MDEDLEKTPLLKGPTGPVTGGITENGVTMETGASRDSGEMAPFMDYGEVTSEDCEREAYRDTRLMSSVSYDKAEKATIQVLTTSGSYISEPDRIEVDIEIDMSTSTTNTQCLMHLLKGMIGTGILAMPVAYKNGGLWVSFCLLFVIGIISTHCMHVLVICGNELCRRTQFQHLDYGSVMEEAFNTGPQSIRRYSRFARLVVNGFLLVTQYGFCCVYNVFVAQNIEQVIEHYQHLMSGKMYVVVIGVLLLPYCMVRNLKALAPFSTFANFLNFIGLGIIMYNLFTGLPDISSRPAAVGIATLPLFFGQCIFAFEGIGLVLPLHNKMQEKSAFLGWFGILNLGLTITVCLYVAVGFYGYLKFGDDTKGSVTLNLPSDDWLYLSVKLMFAVSLFISYGLQFYVPVHIIYPFIVRKLEKRYGSVPDYGEYIFRFVMVIVMCGLSTLVPHLDLLISFFGAFASSFLALILPAVIEIVTFGTQIPVPKWMIVKDTVIIIIGLIGWTTGTYASLRDIVKTF